MQENTLPNQAFMTAFQAATTPIAGSASRLWNDQVVININPRQSEDEVHINKIEAVERGKRHGHAAMGFLTGLADKFGVAMATEAIPTRGDVLYRTVDKLYDASNFSPPQGPPRLRWREPVEAPKAKVQENNSMASGPVSF